MLSRLWAKRGSLLATLALRLFLTTVGLTVVLLSVLYWELHEQVDSLHDRSLTNQAQDIASHLRRAPDGTVSLDLPPELARGYAEASSGYSFQIRDAEGRLLLASSGGAAELDEMTPGGDEEPEFFLLGKPGEARFFAANVPVEGRFGKLLLRVGQGENHGDLLIDQVLEEFSKRVGWVLPLILALFLVVSIVTVKHSLAPIQAISALAVEIGPDNPRPLPEVGLPDEVRPLVRAINVAFQRLQEAFRQQREFTADAAHELRTPLAVLNATIDTLDDAEAKVALKHDLQTMARIVDQLLKVAQLEAFVLDTTQQADLCALVTDVVGRYGHLAIEQSKSILVNLPEQRVVARGDSIVLQHALTNLIENALAHTPRGKSVRITVEPGGTIHVDDEGSGIPESERSLVFQRFWRKSHTTSGAGIGLSIVAKIAQAHHGTVRATTAPGGGARFSLSLPLYS